MVTTLFLLDSSQVNGFKDKAPLAFDLDSAGVQKYVD